MAKKLPTVPEIERSFLGTILLYPEGNHQVLESLEEQDFFEERHQYVFRVLKKLREKGIPSEIPSVQVALEDENLLDLVGGFPYLLELQESAVSYNKPEQFVPILKEKRIQREMIQASEAIAEKGYQGVVDVGEYLSEAEDHILRIARSRQAGDFKDMVQTMDELKDELKRNAELNTDITGYKTAYKDLDRMTHGLQKGDLIVVAARPAMGKTAFALNVLKNVANHNEGAVIMFSLEMGNVDLGRRILSAASGIKSNKLKSPRNLNNDEWNLLYEVMNDFKAKNKIFIDDAPNRKVRDMYQKCREIKKQHGLSLVVVDYIQLLSGDRRPGENRQQEVSEISRALKGLARELEVPVLALSQLSREVEKRENKRPMLSDLRESGAIEQDADIVMMLYRQAYYDKAGDEVEKKPEDEDKSDDLEVIIAKHRNGETGTVLLAFTGSTNAISSVDFRGSRQ
ncbi:replicative DNA helicase [Bulleidia sp. zg-1006]|uniref:replicative DNA helicase n=1 Tax=Bulleidia sp. zg-1006 TaxID=2806552 RepID=UPI0019398D84|nr:replicative DNA helicase [Bulleidia sp. zg-1006]QRG86888.1 replicative DNA helicase [Bulleidia sp. zg-1006]